MLDLFGGSGNMSLEAISRGMEHALVCDVSHAAVSTIHKNVKTLDVASRVTIWKMDYRQVLAKASQEQRTFDLVYLDPPYKKQQILHILQYLDTHDLVNELGDIVCESLKEDEFPDQVGALRRRVPGRRRIFRLSRRKRPAAVAAAKGFRHGAL